MLIRLVLLVLLIPQIVFSADWYIDYLTGNDTTGDGSSGTPYKTIQKAVDVATQGDKFYLSNSTAHILTGAITWNTGFTAGSGYTTFRSWDNGGSITIQRPDEATARVGAEIDGNSVAGQFLSSTSHPNAVAMDSLKIHGMTTYLIREGLYSVVTNCEFDGTGITVGPAIRQEGTVDDVFIGNYVHSYTGSDSAVRAGGFVYRNFIDTASTSVAGQLEMHNREQHVFNNIIKVNGSNTALWMDQRDSDIIGNTFISDGSANAIGVDIAGYDGVFMNNLFSNFDGTSANPVSLSGVETYTIWGNNAYYDSNTPDAPAGTIGIDLTANDISTTGDPFVDSANDDYCVTGSTAEDAAYPAGSLLDIGALECTASGGGGNTYIFAVD